LASAPAAQDFLGDAFGLYLAVYDLDKDAVEDRRLSILRRLGSACS
jgi:hypothetical protein